MTTPLVAAPLRANDLSRAIVHVADCRSLGALGDALFTHANTIIGGLGMAVYLFNRSNRLQMTSSHLAAPDFLDECEREFYRGGRINPMLEYIVAERRAVDGFNFYGQARWRHSSTYSLMRSGGYFHNIGGAFIVGGRVAGVIFAATDEDKGPFEAVHVKHLDLLCRAASSALTAMRDRERLRRELLDAAAEDCHDFSLFDTEWPPDSQSNHGSRGERSNQAEFDRQRPIDRLPPRSRAVAQLLCQGLSNKMIAHQLGISIHTVKEHVKSLCARFDAVNRTELVHFLSIS